MKNTKRLICFDNDGETFDRFTIMNKNTGEMIGSSERPFHPQGFGCYAGNVADNYMNVTFGYGWRNHCDVKKCIKNAVTIFLNDCSHMGKIVPFKSLPDDVQKFAIERL